MKKQEQREAIDLDELSPEDLEQFLQEMGATEEASQEELMEALRSIHPELETYMKLVQFLIVSSDFIAEEPDFKQQFKTIHKAEEDYAIGEPFSPVFESYFNFWAFFDLQNSKNKQTIAAFICSAMDSLADFTQQAKNVCESRLGIYIHQGVKEGFIQLKEIATGNIFPTLAITEHSGQKGEIWLTRILPLVSDEGHYISIQTQYVITDTTEKDWLSFFEKKELLHSEEKLYSFMKFGKSKYYWLDYVAQAVSEEQPGEEYIVLQGLPK